MQHPHSHTHTHIRGEAALERRDEKKKGGQGRRKARQTNLCFCLDLQKCWGSRGSRRDPGEKVVVYCLSPVSLWTLTGAVSQRQDRHKSCQSTALKLYSLAGFWRRPSSSSACSPNCFGSILQGFRFLAALFIYLFIYLHGCHGRVHWVVKERQIPKWRRSAAGLRENPALKQIMDESLHQS